MSEGNQNIDNTILYYRYACGRGEVSLLGIHTHRITFTLVSPQSLSLITLTQTLDIENDHNF